MRYYLRVRVLASSIMLCAHHSCQIVFDLPGPMANNSDHWYFSKEKIRNSPSVKDGIDYAKELGYRQQCANLIQDIGQRLQVYKTLYS